MPFPPYRIPCHEPGCPEVALYKIASTWSDGLTSELKTYGLTCATHLADWYRRSLERQRTCRRQKGETLDVPGLYRLERGKEDLGLTRLVVLEAQLREAEWPPDPVTGG